MTGYLGVRCPVCSKKFSASDDIVVCPICGAPHHRECYFSKGECAFNGEHMSGKAWKPPHEPGEASDEAVDKSCVACNRQSPGSNLFCNYCGHELSAESRQQSGGTPYANKSAGTPAGMPWPGTFPSGYADSAMGENETLGDASAREYSVYVGRRADYYLPRFKMIHSGERQYTLNIPALLLGFIFFFYRKMYLAGALMLIPVLVGFAFSILHISETFPVRVDEMSAITNINMRYLFESAGIEVGSHADVNDALAERYQNIFQMLSALNFGVRVFMSLIFNRLYFQQATRQIRRIREEHASATSGNIYDKNDYDAALAKAGGSNIALVIVLIAAIFLISNIALMQLVT